VLLVQERAYLAHIGSTAGYLVRDAGRPLPETSERLIVTFSGVAEPQVPKRAEAHTAQSILTGALAAVLFYGLLAIR
jgi:hypothetical protein